MTTPLFDLIRHEIAHDGPITVARFMELALGHPEHGYYMTRDPFGLEGDFITSPEITQMFGEMIGLWSVVVWQSMGRPDPVNVVELGPGRGTLMGDALRAAEADPDFMDAQRLWLVETSPVLRDAQKKNLMQTMRMPAWRDSFAETGPGPLLVIGNEFFDALPIRQYEKTAEGWRERLVGMNAAGDGLAFVLAPGAADETLIPETLRAEAEVGAVFEDQSASRAVMTDIAKRVVEHGGAALFFDYGHFEHGLGDTLQAVKDHEYADVLAEPGQADLTAHVDFQQLAEAARAAGAEVLGPLPQGAFLDHLGLRQRADMLMMHADPDVVQVIDGAYNRLTDPDQMGVLFKVMAVTRPGFAVPPWGGGEG
ncbi:MAG: SAM-dependent methyltransferase [Alphaproteobacteria bacterium]|nr:SAM-dependent methyltransferase [Alphaproteobacteria bacterium]